MKALFANVPFVKFDQPGEGSGYKGPSTGPNAGSRWPFTLGGLVDYAPFPFFMGYAVSYLHHHGVDAAFYDAVVEKHWHLELVRERITVERPDVLFLETSTPLWPNIKEIGEWAKEALSCRIVLVGPHIQAFGERILEEENWVDHCVIGEYEKPSLDIMRRLDQADRLYRYDHLQDIDEINGENFVPYRPMSHLYGYWDSSMNTERIQLTVSTSRGCPFKCTYCQWPKVMNDGKYRNRRPELVIDEIKKALDDHLFHLRLVHEELGQDLATMAHMPDRLRGQAGHLMEQGDMLEAMRAYAQHWSLTNLLNCRPISSVFFDDDTWNLGRRRVTEMCAGLKDLGLPWTMMGRIDTLPVDMYDLLMDSGCVGLRFGVESFNQRLVDNTKKNLNTEVARNNLRALVERYNNTEFHLTMMKNLPGGTEADWREDLATLMELRDLAAKRDNLLHWQISDCIAFPGTELWEEMVAQGKADDLMDFTLYDGAPRNNDKLATMVGWLGEDYKPSWSEYSKMGAPTNLPSR